MQQELVLEPHNSGLTIANYPDEQAVLSGGVPLDGLRWIRSEGGNGSNNSNNSNNSSVWKASLAEAGIDLVRVLGLRIDGRRAIRARYPNADPEKGFGSKLKAEQWTCPGVVPPAVEIWAPSTAPNRSGASKFFAKYQLGLQGACKEWTPPAGYWCGNHTQGGDHGTIAVPDGAILSLAKLPNAPYRNASTAVIHAWRPAHWCVWMWHVAHAELEQQQGGQGGSNGSSASYHFVMGKGGFQGARGASVGQELYIENVREELDSEDEWFYDEGTRELYLYNASGPPPASLSIVACNLKRLVVVNGTQSKPVAHVTLEGLTLRDTAITFMDPHGMPSGGDWGVHRGAAVFIQGAVNVTVANCTLIRLDGNAVMLSGYSRNVSIERNSFISIGDSAMLAWGDTTGVPQTPGFGWDGTRGDQPRGTVVRQNFVMGVGVWNKQSSAWFQAKSGGNIIEENIFIEGPRAGKDTCNRAGKDTCNSPRPIRL
jgi:hypothetical protein